MTIEARSSAYRFEKQRIDGVVRLSNGEALDGSFFVASGVIGHEGPERVSDLLNGESGFFPFEVAHGPSRQTRLVNRAHVAMVSIRDPEARRDPGYAVATRRVVSILLSTGDRVTGTIRVYRPEGRERLSDWTHQPEVFRYVETTDHTHLLNTAHIVHIAEVAES